MAQAADTQNTAQNNQSVQPWAGRIYILAGIILLGLSLRYAVTAVAPLLANISADIGMGTGGGHNFGDVAHHCLWVGWVFYACGYSAVGGDANGYFSPWAWGFGHDYTCAGRWSGGVYWFWGRLGI